MNKSVNFSLCGRNTFGFDVSAACYIEFSSTADLRQLFDEGFFAREKWNVLGGGSNILFTADYSGTLLHPAEGGAEVVRQQGDDVLVRVGAGMEWDAFVAWCVAQGFWGVENLSLIPGQTGAAPVQNIGAYGVETKNVIENVEMFMTDTGEIATISAADCAFGYRDSVFKRELKGRAIITAVNFRLSTLPQPDIRYGDLREVIDRLGGATLDNIRRAVIEIRRRKLPDPAVRGNAGSFFKNPVVEPSVAAALMAKHNDMPSYPTGEGVKIPAAWLIDRAGWKGRHVGRVGVHENQPLVLINLGGATGEEVLSLARAIQQDVETQFGVAIEMEVNIL